MQYFFAKRYNVKQEIDINVSALKAYDDGDYTTAIKTFEVANDFVSVNPSRRSPTPHGFSSTWA